MAAILLVRTPPTVHGAEGDCELQIVSDLFVDCKDATSGTHSCQNECSTYHLNIEGKETFVSQTAGHASMQFLVTNITLLYRCWVECMCDLSCTELHYMRLAHT
jgi:hypothetical protein